MNNSYVIKKAWNQYISQFLYVMVIIVPFLIYFGLNYFLTTRLNLYSGFLYEAIVFLLSTFASFVSLKLALQLLRYDSFDFINILNPKLSILHFFIYAVLLYIVDLIVLEVILKIFINVAPSLDFSFLMKLVEPFAEFIAKAKTYSGTVIRILLISNFLIMPFIIVGLFIFNKFQMVPFYILDGEPVLESLKMSFDKTTGFSIKIVLTYMIYVLYVTVLLDILLYFMIIHITNTPEYMLSNTMEMWNYIIYGLLYGFIVPFGILVSVHLFNYLNIGTGSTSSTRTRLTEEF